MKITTKTKLESILNANSGAILADVRSPVSFRDGHVDGAVNLPLKNFVNKVMGLPRTTTIIAYSTNYDDVDLVQGVKYAELLGFTKIHTAEYHSIK